MKNNFKLKIFFVFCLAVFLFLVAGECLAQSCADKYPNDGQCLSSCAETIPEDKGVGLCPTNQTCCHKYAAPVEVQLQVPIFGYTKAHDLAEYIGKIYQYALYVIIPLAILVIMYAGIRWILAAGDPGKIKEAKKYIIDAIIGLTIALLGAVILSLVGITQIQPIRVLAVKEMDSPDTDAPLATIIPTVPEIFCPKSGGSSNLKTVAQSTIGKITYRYGGKGGPPPYQEMVNGPYYQYNNYCPPGTICLDCSGYINFVLQCAGLPQYGGGTKTIFGCNCAASEKITSCSGDSINGIALKPGDVVGYPTDCGYGTGHIYIYGGNGMVYESHGGDSGRQPGASVLSTQLCAHTWTGMDKPTCIKRL
jgi:hypothetical protein